jgi:4-hydroxybenzoate polyprenyltransferase
MCPVYAVRIMTASDIPQDNWIDRILPAAVRPYARLMRLDRPIGTWLLLLPCWWGLALAWRASDRIIPLGEMIWLWIFFSVGALVMRGAGCTVNDLWDRDYDRMVARTRDRPIASGAISVKRALLFLGFQLGIGLLILLQLNPFSQILGVAVLALVFTYPLFKRFTYWPQFVLGLTFNWGALIGWTAVAGALDWPSPVLYLAGIFWTLGYDTIYAHQDKEDDALIGVKSSALALGGRTGPFLWVMYVLTIVGIAASGALAGLSWRFDIVLVLAAGQLAWQAYAVDIDDPKDCHAKFLSNRLFGLIVTAAILVG